MSDIHDSCMPWNLRSKQRAFAVSLLIIFSLTFAGCIANSKRPADKCPVHDKPLHAEIHRNPNAVYHPSSSRMRSDPEYDAAKALSFPYGERELSGGCIRFGNWFIPRSAYLWYCESCRFARDEWMAKRKLPQSNPN